MRDKSPAGKKREFKGICNFKLQNKIHKHFKHPKQGMKKSKLEGKIREEIEKLLELSKGYIESESEMHEMEQGILSQLLMLGLAILKVIISEKLKGLAEYEVSGESYKSTGKKTRNYLSLFGRLEVERPSYWSENLGEFHKLDECLKLPIGSYWSYNIQKLVGTSSTETDYRESVRTVNELLSLGLSGKSSERNVGRIGEHVEKFYDLNSYQSEEEGSCFVAGFDGKGVPKIKPALEIRGNPKERLARGEKRGVKQMATVSVTSSFTPERRTSESILMGLMGKEESDKEEESKEKQRKKRTDNKLHKNIHRRAFLADQEKAVEYGLLDLKRRMTNKKDRFIVPIDAGIGLEAKVLACVKEYKLQSKFDGIVLDIVHVSEYVWDAGSAIFGENKKLRREWVRKVLKDLLEGRTDEVILCLELNRDKTSLTDNKKEQLNKTITYFTNHKHKMDYQRFLKKGYPISSAIVESTCKHLVKDRMEQSGMRWSSQGAQNMMDLRAVKVNDNMTEFMAYVIEKDRKVNLTKRAA